MFDHVESPNPTIVTLEWMRENHYVWTKSTQKKGLIYNLFLIHENNITFITKEQTLAALIKYVRVVLMQVEPA